MSVPLYAGKCTHDIGNITSCYLVTVPNNEHFYATLFRDRVRLLATTLKFMVATDCICPIFKKDSMFYVVSYWLGY
jgi:hypothetical protein